MTTQKNRFVGCLLGVRIGDALGMPFEILAPEQIASITDPDGVTTFMSPQHRSDAPKWTLALGSLKPGDHTDDWQMTRAGAKSLVRKSACDLMDLAREYVREHDLSDKGWGGTTRQGLAQIKEWFESSGAYGRNPTAVISIARRSAGKQTGLGNGVAMRIAPFGLWNSARSHNQCYEMVMSVGALTHEDFRASTGAFVIAMFIAILAANDSAPMNSMRLWEIFQNILIDIRKRERVADGLFSNDLVSHRLQKILDLYRQDPQVHRAREELGTSSNTLESVPFCVATFLRHPTDFRAALKEAVEAGGDTDTNAAIVGSLVGANTGVEGIPREWRDFREDFQEAEELGRLLYEAAVLR